jgi:hypothetical protein
MCLQCFTLNKNRKKRKCWTYRILYKKQCSFKTFGTCSVKLRLFCYVVPNAISEEECGVAPFYNPYDFAYNYKSYGDRETFVKIVNQWEKYRGWKKFTISRLFPKMEENCSVNNIRHKMPKNAFTWLLSLNRKFKKILKTKSLFWSGFLWNS